MTEAMSDKSLRTSVKSAIPEPLILLLQMVRYPYGLFRRPNDLRAAASFLRSPLPEISFGKRFSIIKSLCRATVNVDCAHTEREMLTFMNTILAMSPDIEGCIVEAGCCKGGSTAKFSLAAKYAGRRLVVFDSFEGLPENEEEHGSTILGETPNFSAGRYAGTLEEVRSNVRQHGEIEVCDFIPGWFESTMPNFHQPVAAIYLDVDLVMSTRTCLINLYPLLSPGGYIYSQDGHLPRVIELLSDDRFWETEVKHNRPEFEGLGTQKLVWAQKELSE